MEMPVTQKEIDDARAHLIAWLRWHMRAAKIPQQQELARQLGVSKGSVTHWFKRDAQMPAFAQLLAISKLLKVNLDTLITRDPPEHP